MSVGDTLRRLIEKVALVLEPTKELMRSMLQLQTGLFGSVMCKQVALSLKNAFNSVHRNSILEAVGRQADHLLPWTQQSLQSSTLFLGEHTLLSSEGGQQGAPLSLFFFSMAIHDVSPAVPLKAASYWYLDDGTIMSDLPSLR